LEQSHQKTLPVVLRVVAGDRMATEIKTIVGLDNSHNVGKLFVTKFAGSSNGDLCTCAQLTISDECGSAYIALDKQRAAILVASLRRVFGELPCVTE
jgi:hypothetical protein